MAGPVGGTDDVSPLRAQVGGNGETGTFRVLCVAILNVPVFPPEWKPRYASYPSFVRLAPTPTNGLTKEFGADAFQVKSVSRARFLDWLGERTLGQMDDIANAIAICVGAP